MPSFSRSLEQALHRALALANQYHHEFATLEHLLMALTDDADAAAVMRACSVDIALLQRNLTHYIDEELVTLLDRLRDRSVIHIRHSVVLVQWITT
jgi:ATP-dependent Clp protease ATP-binding subunit ClpA